jgi:hypothetical protein
MILSLCVVEDGETEYVGTLKEGRKEGRKIERKEDRKKELVHDSFFERIRRERANT